MIGLNYPSTICVSYTPGGAEPLRRNRRRDGDFERARRGGSPYYLVLYASAADPIDDQADDTEVSGDISLVSCSGGSSSSRLPAPRRLQAAANVQQRDRISGSRLSGNQNVKVGQLMNLQVQDPSGTRRDCRLVDAGRDHGEKLPADNPFEADLP